MLRRSSYPRLFRGLLVGICLLSVGACSNTRRFARTEDVQLPDKRMIVIHRSEESRRNVDPGAGFRTGWLFQKATISADM